MPRFLLKFALFITFALTVSSLTARQLGSTQPSNPALRGFIEGCDGKPQPCWYGIIPGVTTLAQVKDNLLSNGYAVDSISDIQLIATKAADGDCQRTSIVFAVQVRQISVELCESVLLGDFIQQFDQQTYVMLDPLSLWYRGEIQIIFGKHVSSWDTVTYHTPLGELILFPDKGRLPHMRQPWLDLLLLRKYCKLHGLQYVCSD